MINFIQKHAKLLIVINTFIILLSALGLNRVELEYSQKSWFREGDKLLANYQKFKDEYGADSSLILLIKFRDEISNPANIERLKQLENDLWKIPNFVRIESILNFNQTTAEADEILVQPIIPDQLEQSSVTEITSKLRNNKEIQNYLLSDDLKTTAVYGYLRIVKDQESKAAQIVVAEIKKRILPKYKDLDIKLTGPASMAAAFKQESTSDMSFLIPLAFVVLFVILTLFLKNIFLAVLSLALILFTLVSTLGIQGWLDIKLGLVTGMCPLIVIAICVVDLVHILSGYVKYEGSITKSLQHNLKPTALTSITTIIGFCSFLSAKLYPIADLGKLASIGIGLAWIYTIFLIAPILYLIPIRKNFYQPIKVKTNLFSPVNNLLQRHPMAVVIIFLAMTAANIDMTLSNKIDSNMQNYFAPNTEFAVATKQFKQEIGATNNVEIILNAPDQINNPEFLKKTDLLIAELEKREDISKVISLVHPLKEVNQMMNGGSLKSYRIDDDPKIIAQELFFLEISLPPEKSIKSYHSIDKSQLRLSLFWHNSSSAQIEKASREVELLIKKHGLTGYLTGIAPLITGLDKYIIQSFVESMLLATICIAVFMMFVFRSFFIGLLSILPNIIVPSFGAAVLYLLDKPFDTSSVLVFSICLGIAIDDTIYFITMIQEKLKQNTPIDKAIEQVLAEAGKTLSMTTLILISIFSLFYLGSFVPYQNFAIATGVILSFALILDLMFLPSLLLIFKRGKLS